MKKGSRSLLPFSKKEDDKKSLFPPIKIKAWQCDLKNISIIENYTIGRSEIFLGERRNPDFSIDGIYFVQDPKITEERLVLIGKIASELVYKQKADELSSRKDLTEDEKYLIERTLQGFSSIDPLMKDPYITDIECSRSGTFLSVTVETDKVTGRLTTNLVYSEEELQSLIKNLAGMAGKDISKANPRIDNATLPDGSRFVATFMSEISPSSTFTIRKFPKSGWTPTKLLKNSTITPEVAAWLWLLIENRLPILVCGAMGSGKTSLINASCGFVRSDSRVGTIEDVAEFKLPLEDGNWLRHFTRESTTSDGKPITQAELLKQMLRENIDYMVVNEVRSKEDTEPWVNAVASGHGGLTSFHAPDLNELIVRLEQLGLKREILSVLKGGIIFIERFSDGKGLKRRIREMIEVCSEEGNLKHKVLMRYDRENDNYVFNIKNSKVVELLCKNGINVEEELVKRKEYIEWIKRKAEIDEDVLEPEGFRREMKKYYNNPLYYKEEEKMGKEERGNKEKVISIGPKLIGVSSEKKPPKVRLIKEMNKAPPKIIKTCSLRKIFGKFKIRR